MDGSGRFREVSVGFYDGLGPGPRPHVPRPHLHLLLHGFRDETPVWTLDPRVSERSRWVPTTRVPSFPTHDAGGWWGDGVEVGLHRTNRLIVHSNTRDPTTAPPLVDRCPLGTSDPLPRRSRGHSRPKDPT